MNILTATIDATHATILGGLIAGIIGLISQLLALCIKRRRQNIEWNQRMIRLCKRIQFEQRDCSHIDTKYTYSDVQPLIEDHLASSPSGVDDKIHNIYENNIYNEKFKFEVGSAGTAEDPDEEAKEKVSEAASDIIDNLESGGLISKITNG